MLAMLLNGHILQFAILLLAIVVSLSLHEFGHAGMATALGDDTPRRMGRLTLNPLAHIDPLGLLMVVMVGFGSIGQLTARLAKALGMEVVAFDAMLDPDHPAYLQRGVRGTGLEEVRWRHGPMAGHWRPRPCWHCASSPRSICC